METWMLEMHELNLSVVWLIEHFSCCRCNAETFHPESTYVSKAKDHNASADWSAER